jgi:hypothetical protein
MPRAFAADCTSFGFGLGKTGVGRVDEEGDRPFCRLDLMQQFEALCGRCSLLQGYAREVASGTVEACDKANRDRIAATAKTIGIVWVADFAAKAAVVTCATAITVTRCSTRPPSIVGIRS